MGSNESELNYQQKVELRSDLRKRLQNRFTIKLSLNSGPWENPRSETDNLHARKGYVKRTLKMLHTISNEKNATIEYPKDLERELSPPGPPQSLLNENSSLYSATTLLKF